MSIGEQLAAARKARGLTAAELGALTGLHPSNIYSIEHGRRQARAETLETLAAGLGARFLLVDTRGRASVAEIAARIRDHLHHDRPQDATAAFLQLANNLRGVSPLGCLALAQDSPTSIDAEWDAAIAGVVEWLVRGRGLPSPEWTRDAAGDPSWRWSPWGTVAAGSHLLTSDEVPEPLRRRGILIESGELDAA